MATFAGLFYDKAETMDISFTTSATGVSSATSTSVLVGPAAATQLVIAQEPSATATAGQPISPGPVIDFEDQYDNLETGDNSTVVTAMLKSGAGPLTGTPTATVSGGVARFSNLVDDRAETISLVFTTGTLSSSPTSSVVVSPGTASKLVIATQPSSSATAGVAFAVQPVVDVEDQDGNIETGDNTTVVSVALSNGGGLPEGTTSVTVKDGVATFAGLNETTAGTIALQFSAGSLTAGPSSNILVSPAAPFRLKIETQPSSTATAGQAFGTQPVIDELDQYGNLETTDSGTVITASLSFGNGPLLGTTKATLAGGVATFTNLADSLVGTIALGFSGGGLSVGPSNNIVITAGVATGLKIQTQPYASVTAGSPLTDPIVVDEVDAYGNIVSSDNSTKVTASLSTGGGTLYGDLTATVSGGIAMFNDLENDTAGSLTLQFSASGLPAVISNPAVVSPGPVSVIKIVSRPPSGIISGIAFGGLVVDAMDNYGNVVTSFDGEVTAALASGSAGRLSGTTTVAAVNGEASFDNLISDTSGSIALTASASANGTSVTSPPTGSIVVSPAPANHFVVTTSFANPDVAGSVGTVTVTAEDQFGNIAGSSPDQYMGTVDLSSTDSQVANLPTNYTFTAADAGSYTFTSVALKTAGSQTITATDSADDATTGTSVAVNVVPGRRQGFHCHHQLRQSRRSRHCRHDHRHRQGRIRQYRRHRPEPV